VKDLSKQSRKRERSSPPQAKTRYFLFFVICGTGDWTKGLVHVGRAFSLHE
jgi:protein involved in temperature-dependent protein secretion